MLQLAGHFRQDGVLRLHQGSFVQLAAEGTTARISGCRDRQANDDCKDKFEHALRNALETSSQASLINVDLPADEASPAMRPLVEPPVQK